MAKGSRSYQFPGSPGFISGDPMTSSSVEYHLFRLESFCLGLHDLCDAAANGRRIDRRRLLAAAGAGFLADIPGESGFIRRALELGSRLCNQALDSLRHETRAHQLPERDAQMTGGHVLRLRDLLIALHDLLEANQYRYDYPHEREAAHRHLAILLDLGEETTQKQLIDRCFASGAALAGRALESLLEAR